MKTLIQTCMLLGTMIILADITACNHTPPTKTFSIEGQFINVLSRQPVGEVLVEMHSLEGPGKWSSFANEEGRFHLEVQGDEGQDYKIKIKNSTYRIVNPNTQVSKHSEEQVWYLLPSDKY